jgi:hypothetical protein
MRTHRTSWFFVAAIACLLVGYVPSDVLAQYNYYQSSSFAFNQFNYPPIGDNTKYRSKKSNDAAKPAAVPSASSGPTSGRASPTNNPLPYTRDKAITEKVKEAFLQDYAKQMPGDAKDMREITAQNDVVQVIAGFTQLAGLDSGTMEGVMAFWYGQAWAIANQKPLPTKQQYQGIAEQLKASAAKSKWSTMSNAERQAFYEHLAYPMFVQKANYTAYLKHGKTDSMARMSAAVREGLKKTGVNLESLELGNSGFERL